MSFEGITQNIEKKELPPKTVAIFDFDGTIADSRDTLGHIINELADEYGYEKLDENEVLKYTSKKAQDFIREDLKLSWLQIPGFASRLRSELNKKITELKPISGMVEVVKELKSRNYKLGIISSNSEDNIRQFLINNDIDIFDFVSSGSSLLGKARNIKSVLSREGFEAKNVVYVGDEIRDRDAADKAGIDVVIVSWGYNSKDSLEKDNKSIIIDSPSQLLDLLPSQEE
jgi:phosphoglycolate phosphatase